MVAEFDGGALTSDAGGLLLGAADRRVDLVRRLAGCFRDARDQRLVEHSVATLIGQRVFGIALGYEDLNDHDELRHDPLMAVLAGKLEAWRSDCAPTAGKSTLNRLELSREIATRYHKISHDPAAIEALFVDLFLEAHARPPRADRARPRRHRRPAARPSGRPVLSRLLRLLLLSASVCVLRPASHGGQAQAVEHRRRAGAVEEVARIVGQIRARWPRTRILLRADSGFAREALMAWCEENRVDFVFGLARNRGSSRRSPSNSSRPKRRRPRPASLPAATRTSAMRRSTAGRAGAG